ncbi:MAG: hypothetical protein DHS20C03_26490 [Minwuia thermotolerans]|nr:MAG: hypothetical protein DHS20C03_26490 [Minwuia thermotolerans]
MAIRIEPSEKTIDREDVARTVAVAMAYGAAGEPHGTFRFSLEALVKLRPKKGGKAGERAWFLWQEALAETVARVLAGEPWNVQPTRLQQMTTELLWASAERMRISPIMLYRHHLDRPRSFLPYESARRDIVLAICTGPLAERRSELEKALNAAFTDAFAAARQADPEYYGNLVDDRTSVPAERQRQWDEHRDRIGREIMVDPIFGQDRITLHDLYIPPRCIYSTIRHPPPDEEVAEEDREKHRGRVERKLEAHVQDLRETVLAWWRNSDSSDRIRLIGGAPGSGKSSFAKMLAWEVGAEPEECVLFVPLHRIGGTDALRDHVRQHLTDANGGGFDAESDPLSWLGRAGQDDCLLIFDGLDELGEAQNPDRFGEMVRNLRDLVVSLDGSEKGDGRVRAVVLGRNIAVSEARERLGLSPEQWLEVLPMAPAPRRGQSIGDWVKEKAKQFGRMVEQADDMLAVKDDRPAYWEKWQSAHRQQGTEIPPGLRPGNLDEFSVEPLLCYLLLFSGLADERWKEVEDNRGILFRKILYDIHQRNWGADGSGHPAGPESFAQFLTLMAGFALAAWHGGGRVGSTDDYERALGALRPSGGRKLLNKDFAKLKNVALMLHTRTEGQGDEKSFEFIHKSFGDYLVALALADAGLQWVGNLESDSISEEELLGRWLALTGGAPITEEILGFLKGEIASDLEAPEWTDEERAWRGGIDLLPPSNQRRAYRGTRLSKPSEWAEGRLAALKPVFARALTDGFPAHEGSGRTESWRQNEIRHRYSETSLLALVQALAEVAGPFGESGDTSGSLDFFPGEDAAKMERHRHLRSLVLRLIMPDDNLAELARRRLFAGISARGTILAGQNLEKICMRRADLGHCILTRTLLIGAELDRANLEGANLEHAYLSGASLIYTSLTGAIFSGANMHSADLRWADLRQTQFTAAKLQNSDLSGADLCNADLIGSELDGAQLVCAKLSSAQLPATSLRRANFRGAHLVRASLLGADLRDADLTGADLREAVLVDADLTNAKLSGADLRGTRIKGIRGLDEAQIADLINRGALLQGT